jgi:hypothetical protein
MLEHDQMLLTKYHQEYRRRGASTGIRNTLVHGICITISASVFHDTRPKFSGHSTEEDCEFRVNLLPSSAVLSDLPARNESDWVGEGYGVTQEVRNLGSARSEGMFDRAKGRARQDGLVRGDTAQLLNTFRCDMYNNCQYYACQRASR